MIGYVYYTKNTINGRPYVGSHISNVFDDKYYGSGKALLRALKKYGKKSFKRKILYKATDIDNLYEMETYFIKKIIKKHGSFAYNIALNALKPMLGRKHTEETKKKYSLDRTGEKNQMYGVRLVGELNPRYGVKLSEETKRKIGEANSKVFGKNHGNFGKIRSEEMKKKMSKSKLGLLSTSCPNDLITKMCEETGLFYSLCPSSIKNIITSYRCGVWQKTKTIEKNINRLCDFMELNKYYNDLVLLYKKNSNYYGVSR